MNSAQAFDAGFEMGLQVAEKAFKEEHDLAARERAKLVEREIKYAGPPGLTMWRAKSAIEGARRQYRTKRRASLFQ